MKKFSKLINIFMSLVVAPTMIGFYATTQDENFFYLIAAYVGVVFFGTLLMFAFSFIADFPEEMILEVKADEAAHPHIMNFWYVVMAITILALFFYVNSIIAGLYLTTCAMVIIMRYRLMIGRN